ncbi:MAG: DUF983 domain-containing protein [Roseibium sp.]|uniref:DUF983 domain-containing protein n=1 Tax=Roseibium sp. TaxID=1936156 RepID=UPI001B12817B|nr:DUF983 domain-containing protein [Roseibium sp.]MBO6890633.1 DUF983 domain-containing protein [Roseibium sp.]MBO6930104.1 DUF983 domain-containing protein [Roseibium sp.]
MEDKAHFPPVNPAAAGLAGTCPRCGQGRLFDGFLTVRKSCSACGLDYSFADSGDGPAVFVIMIVGFVIVGLVLFVELTFQPPIWLHLIIWLPLTIGLAAATLRPLKGLMIALQYKHEAREARLDEDQTS